MTEKINFKFQRKRSTKESPFQERLSSVVNARITIEAISRSLEAQERKEEILLALKSTYSQQQQEFNSMRIFNMPTNFVNISQIDGAAIPYRFSILVGLQYLISKTKVVPYFDNFSTSQVLIDK